MSRVKHSAKCTDLSHRGPNQEKAGGHLIKTLNLSSILAYREEARPFHRRHRRDREASIRRPGGQANAKRQSCGMSTTP